MSPLTLVIIIGGVGLLGAGLFAAASHFLRETPARIVAVPNPVVLKQYDTVSVEVTLQRRTWAGGQWFDTHGTWLVRTLTSEVFAVSPDRGSTIEGEPAFRMTITGMAPGTDILRVSGTPAGRSQACVGEVHIQVEPNEENRKRIRQSAASLSNSVRT